MLLVALLLPAGVWFGSEATARASRPVVLADIDDVKDKVADLLFLDPRPQAAYLKAHIPYSHPVEIEVLETAILTPGGPDPAVLLAAMRGLRLPFNPWSGAVLYDIRRPARMDGYLAWLLAYAGLPRIQVLDGGFGAWVQRRRLGVYMGPPIPMGVPSLQLSDIHPRPDLRFDPGDLSAGLPEGATVVEILPAGGEGRPRPGSRQLQADEFLDENGFFLFPNHLERLLRAREVQPQGLILLKGRRTDQGLAWVALTANGYKAALIRARILAPQGHGSGAVRLHGSDSPRR